MRILERAEALERTLARMKKEWLKIEVLQGYSGGDDCPSLRAWTSGNKQQRLGLLKQTSHEDCFKKYRGESGQGVLMQRIRIVEKPYTPYKKWEMEFYKRVNAPGGEQIFIVVDQT